MPYKSEAQRKYFNSPEGKKKIGPEEVEHWNEVSKGMKLPKKVEEDKEMNVLDKAIKNCDMAEYVPGRKIPSHNIYNNKYDVNDLRARLDACFKGLHSDERDQIAAGVLLELVRDYKADINNKELDKDETEKHYRKYRDVVNKYYGRRTSSVLGSALNKFVSTIN